VTSRLAPIGVSLTLRRVARSARHVRDILGEPNAPGIGLFLFWYQDEEGG